MADTSVKSSPVLSQLCGKKFMFKGKLSWNFDKPARRLLALVGAELVNEVTADLDYLVADGRGSTDARKQAEKLNKSNGNIKFLTEDEVRKLFRIDKDEFLDLVLKEGKAGVSKWNQIHEFLGTHKDGMDFSSMSLKDSRLEPVNLNWITVDSADFSGVKAKYLSFSTCSNCNFSKAKIRSIALDGAEACDFSQAKLSFIQPASAHDKGGFVRSNLRGANLQRLTWTQAKAKESDFSQADFSDCTIVCGKLSGNNFSSANFENANLSETDFSGANLSGANLRNTNLSFANLSGANLSNADLSGAVLLDADLSGANVTGTNLSGAHTARLNLKNVKIDLAKGYSEFSESWKKQSADAACKELQAWALKQYHIGTSVDIIFSGRRITAQAAYERDWQKNKYRWIAKVGTAADTDLSKTWYDVSSCLSQSREIGEADELKDVLDLFAARYHMGQVDLSRAQLHYTNLKNENRLNTITAWCEAFGLPVPDLAVIDKQRADARKELRDNAIEQLKGETKRDLWDNAKASRYRSNIDLTKIDLKSCNLDDIEVCDIDFSGSNFEGVHIHNANAKSTTLSKGKCKQMDAFDTDFSGASFASADLQESKLVNCSLAGANLSKANLSGALLVNCDFTAANLSGTNLSKATLSQVEFSGAKFNEITTFPEGFEVPITMVWAGKGESPLLKKTIEHAISEGPMDFESFMANLSSSVDPDRLKKSLKMLQSESFQLFADVSEEALVGIVKSQTDASLLYSCRLTSSGMYACCSQNLNPCGGLRGAVCKHLLVLIVGLARSGQFDPATANIWVRASQAQKPQLDKDIMSETLLRYKGAEAGEIDWRPTETIPEDYYAI